MSQKAASERGHRPRAFDHGEAVRLRKGGMKIREIAERMGVAVSTVHAWLSDPDGSRLKARKDSYRGTCVVCGGQTDGGRGAALAPELCMSCREWGEDAIIAAIQTWAAGHGGIPPTTTEWRRADTDHPCASVVIKRLGWNNALLRAGFGLKCDRRRETRDWMVSNKFFPLSNLRVAYSAPKISTSCFGILTPDIWPARDHSTKGFDTIAPS